MKPTPEARFTRRFVELCEKRDISQNELARRLQSCGLKTSPSSVNGWFHGTIPPGWVMLHLPAVLGCSAEALFGNGKDAKSGAILDELEAAIEELRDRYG